MPLWKKSALQLRYEPVFIKPVTHEQVQRNSSVHIVCHFLTLAVNTLIFGISRCNLFVFTQVEFDILLNGKLVTCHKKY